MRGDSEQPHQQVEEATPLLRLRLIDLASSSTGKKGPVTSGLLTVWRPEGQLAGLLEEGQAVGLANCWVGRQEAATIHLTASRATQYLQISSGDAQPAGAARRLVSVSNVTAPGFQPPFNEVDLVGLVLAVGEPPRTADFQPVYICDREGFLLHASCHSLDAALQVKNMCLSQYCS
jgi:hypothetical protein